MQHFDGSQNPLLSNSPADWDQLIRAVGPASLLVLIEARMGPKLRNLYAAEDVFQDALLLAWRDRMQCQWRGLKSFRCWLLTVIDHHLGHLARQAAALKRGGERATTSFSAMPQDSPSGSGTSEFAGPVASTTPSRIAMYKEQAAAMRAALEGLPDELREAVRFRLFEQLTLQETAERLGIGLAAARYRFGRGIEVYRSRLAAEMVSRSRAKS